MAITGEWPRPFISCGIAPLPLGYRNGAARYLVTRYRAAPSSAWLPGSYEGDFCDSLWGDNVQAEPAFGAGHNLVPGERITRRTPFGN